MEPSATENKPATIHHLTIRRQMHEELSRLPNYAFYEGTLQNDVATKRNLEDVQPGLAAALTDILKSIGNNGPFVESILRRHYIVINGTRVTNEITQSKVVHEHCRFFCTHMFERLHEIFGDTFREKVLVLVAHGESLKYWNACLHEIMNRRRLSTKHVPEVSTIESAQVRGAVYTINDFTIQQMLDKRDAGFMIDHHRFNTGITRAEAVQTTLGGNCEGRFLSMSMDIGPGAGEFRGCPIPVVHFRDHLVNNQVTYAYNEKMPESEYPAHLRQDSVVV
ncbi:uncharacterized protein LTR77_008098 [Saxophila tyrrhenica]|uniref:DNA2/NAM7 helicase-like C-terminal domain-containing protein n=1 Tax=Saxophila tyrrhenica TaxID=1690608 RepID=A0AAV9P3S6_9PEZI|nr:hypothetical protein LTR77_008098 [Saxophila tyrrhenica]